MNEFEQLKGVLKILGISGVEFAGMLGIKYASYRTMTAKNAKTVPKWVSAFLKGWKLAHDESLMCIECEIRENGHGIGFMFCEECIDDE